MEAEKPILSVTGWKFISECHLILFSMFFHVQVFVLRMISKESENSEEKKQNLENLKRSQIL